MELYVHIPFCRQKCRYCSFASFPAQETDYERYTKLLLKEARLRKHIAGERISTVYIGGGTPSLLPPDEFRRLVAGLSDIFALNGVAEFTVEANPGTVSRLWLEAAVASGVNRISFGMQAYQDRLLQLLGRIHRFEDVRSSVSLARESGVRNISIDLIFGIPGQTIGDWDRTTDEVLALQPEHISAYGLIPEEGTPLYKDLEKGLLSLPDPEAERDMYDLVIRKTADAGFHQYEISNFARDSFECRHNIGYWTLVPYLGLGVSAASMYGMQSSPDGISYSRSVNPDTLAGYEEMVCRELPAASERISPAEARFETMMLGLRMNRGVSKKEFLDRHHVTLDRCYGDKLREMEKQGLLVSENGSWKMTARGFDIQNSVLVELMDS